MKQDKALDLHLELKAKLEFLGLSHYSNGPAYNLNVRLCNNIYTKFAKTRDKLNRPLEARLEKDLKQ